MSPVYAPGPHYLRWYEVLLFGRKNGPKAKPQKDRGRTRGGKHPAKPPHRGGKSGKGKK